MKQSFSRTPFLQICFPRASSPADSSIRTKVKLVWDPRPPWTQHFSLFSQGNHIAFPWFLTPTEGKAVHRVTQISGGKTGRNRAKLSPTLSMVVGLSGRNRKLFLFSASFLKDN